jgi:hypothetical protein
MGWFDCKICRWSEKVTAWVVRLRALSLTPVASVSAAPDSSACGSTEESGAALSLAPA